MQLQTQLVQIDLVKGDIENARIHSDENINAICKSLQTFGQRKPIVVWQGFVIAGNGTLKAAKKLGWNQIVVTHAPEDWTHEQARAFSLVDNQTATLATWDESLRWTQMIDLDAAGWEMTDFGFASVSFNGMSEAVMHDKNDPPAEVLIKFRSNEHANKFFQRINRPCQSIMFWPK